MATLQIRVDDALKNQAQIVAEGMGIDISSAVRIFLAQMVKENGFPFLPTNDPFWSRKNQEALQKSAIQIAEEDLVSRDLDELRSME